MGTAYDTDNFTSIRSMGSMVVGDEKSAILQSSSNNQITTSMLLITARKSFDNVNASFTPGNNAEDSKRQRQTVTWFGRNFIDPNFASINNVLETNRTVSQNTQRRRIVDLNLDWKGIQGCGVMMAQFRTFAIPRNEESLMYDDFAGYQRFLVPRNDKNSSKIFLIAANRPCSIKHKNREDFVQYELNNYK